MSESKGGFKGMLKLGVILALYSSVACVGLAFVYAGTATIIAERQQADLEAALSELFQDADEFRAITGLSSPNPAVSIEGDENNPGNTGAFAALKNGVPIGVALRLSRFSYGGEMKLLVGVSAGKKISGVKILEHSDTPGLGANSGSKTYYVDRAKGIHFYDQFAGKSVNDPFEPKQDVIAITAATVTSRAVSSAVKAAGEAASAWLAGQGGSR
jgi:electron transport complex protein RnfG